MSRVPNWKRMALECLDALRLLDTHYSDLVKNNLGFISKIHLEDYFVWHNANIIVPQVLLKYKHVKIPDLYPGVVRQHKKRG